MKKILALWPLAIFSAGCATPTQLLLDAEIDRLCAIDGGITIYEPVLLPPEKFNEFGTVRVPAHKYLKPGDEYYYDDTTEYLKNGKLESGEVRMWRSDTKVFRLSDGKLLGRSISYTRAGGDVPGPWHHSSYTCPDPNRGESLGKQIFLKGNNK